MPGAGRAISKNAVGSPSWLRSARQRLVTWYRRHARELSWRGTRDPYAVWVSEIMLQQTQVATVERYFPRFLEAFPTIATLAAAPEDRVLRLWEGLGYYRRARQMHAAAKKIVADHDGIFPREIEAVRALPGIGRYTAGAILSIAFDQRQPILEANTIRLLSRLLAYRGDQTSSAGQQLLWQLAEAILPQSECGHFNQALMELGSLVCTPREPKCDACPLQLLCPTRRAGLQAAIPAPKRQPQLEDLHEIAVIIVRRGQVLLRKCAEGERWAGLWDFPRFGVTAGNGTSLPQQIADRIRQLTSVEITSLQHVTTLRHGVTRYRIKLDGYIAKFESTAKKNDAQTQQWVRPVDLESFPLSTTGRKLAKFWHANVTAEKKRRA